MTDKVRRHADKATTSDLAIIPGGLTSQVQPADVSWNKPFKSAYRELYDKWMAEGDKSFTASGNLKAPEKLLCLQWVNEAWNSVSSEVIQKSFLTCGISVATDGSQDNEIHCLKQQEAAPVAAEIEMLTKRLADRGKESESDLYSSLDGGEDTDDEELQTNEDPIDDD